MKTKKTLRTCVKGHEYYKSSDCPVCPICEKESNPATDFLALFSAPARRALEKAGIINPEKLSGYYLKDILALHGIGKSSVPVLIKALEVEGLSFKS
ncbi:RNA polymerase alpha subunit C-terminal domain-containing protein [Polluticaenibacter yanchengensis]|uniref:RNA polymerase alpha subunit C-terminal domain-containing protein n=1 Tax=Polluticaenibacter yanchengensis TaxID=3014562 RepID=A0ABT4UK43_9BACT|nr:RNA polymerase alpha subunit C-terminal domain-containing protein [Chitinophagaceae bacterium LY-5]